MTHSINGTVDVDTGEFDDDLDPITEEQMASIAVSPTSPCLTLSIESVRYDYETCEQHDVYAEIKLWPDDAEELATRLTEYAGAVRMTKAHLVRFFGERCPEHEPGCPVCEAWANYDKSMEAST